MRPLRELHLAFREESRADTAWRQRMAGRKQCPSALRHDPDAKGLCRWCQVKCDRPVPAPAAVHEESEGAILIQEAYDYHFNPDCPSQPRWGFLSIEKGDQ